LFAILPPDLDARNRRERDVSFRERGDSRQEPGAGDAQSHRVRIVAIDATDGMRMAGVLQLLVKVLIAVLVSLFETSHRIPGAQLSVERHDRGVAVETGP